MNWLDDWIALWMLPLALWLLASGLDDLLVDFVWLADALRRKHRPAPPDASALAATPRRRIAVWIPLWREHRVIGRMLERNLAAVAYRPFEVFVGCYPNDEPTLEAARESAARYPNVHLALCPHDGPTSKADCLNWIYQRMLVFEKERGVRFEIVVTHDAEDWMHPLELDWINWYAARYDMIQIPVFPLPTPWLHFTHGVYCDEFAEYQAKDVPVRLRLGAALPGNGVGTGYRRDAIERLAAAGNGSVFDPTALTEDYASGLRLHRLGCRQFFAGPHFVDGAPVATREYFPQSFRSAARQRKRWVTGIALQGWRQFGWKGRLAEIYFLWRDRKGLLGNPLSVVVNFLFGYGLLTWLHAQLTGEPWGLGQNLAHPWLFLATLGLQVWRVALRSLFVSRVYGWRFALGAPLRVVWANLINATATLGALSDYALAHLRGRPLRWAKTEHRYPRRALLLEGRTKLGELLVGSGWLRREELEQALACKPPELRLGEFLVKTGRVDERAVYAALSQQQNLPLASVHPQQVRRAVARSLPAAVIRKWQVLPFKVASGNLFVASPEIPCERMEQELR
ncbi:MAG: glycosyl transferase family protein, partial [Bryobacterales bacterium]|nr:glycosyl transferase family protein [Bryobacteraceae bacterium]MDW8131708.1 glycosyl transferase family protein [Bryobacterales bacterium]